MLSEGGSMFDELAIFDVKLVLRDPADLVEYRQIMAKLKEINFSKIINTALQNILSQHDLLILVKAETTLIK